MERNSRGCLIMVDIQGKYNTAKVLHKGQTNIRDIKDAMKGIFMSCVSSAMIDESPMAYKPMDEIIANIEPTCSIEKIIKPVYNFKAAF